MTEEKFAQETRYTKHTIVYFVYLLLNLDLDKLKTIFMRFLEIFVYLHTKPSRSKGFVLEVKIFFIQDLFFHFLSKHLAYFKT